MHWNLAHSLQIAGQGLVSFCGHSTWKKNKHNFHQLEWNEAKEILTGASTDQSFWLVLSHDEVCKRPKQLPLINQWSVSSPAHRWTESTAVSTERFLKFSPKPNHHRTANFLDSVAVAAHFKCTCRGVWSTEQFVSQGGPGIPRWLPVLPVILLQEACCGTKRACYSSWRLINKVVEQQHRCWLRSQSWRDELIIVPAENSRGAVCPLTLDLHTAHKHSHIYSPAQSCGFTSDVRQTPPPQARA